MSNEPYLSVFSDYSAVTSLRDLLYEIRLEVSILYNIESDESITKYVDEQSLYLYVYKTNSLVGHL